jgi:hypothetical protein
MKKKFTIFSILTLTCFGLFSQFRYKTNLGQVLSSTYLDLGTSGTQITTANTDDDNSAATPIGFTFDYNGTNYTDFVLNTNGFIKLGTVAPTANIFGALQTGLGGVLMAPTSAGLGNQNCISAFNVDLIGNPGAEYRVSTDGSAPNRVCTIQYKDVTEKAAVHFASMNFQIKLYETTNVIEFVYGTFTNAATNATFKIASLGLIGADTSNANTIFMRKASAGLWAAATFVTRNTVVAATNQILSYRNNGPTPISGLTYRFKPQDANDLLVDRIEALASAAIPFTNIETVRARISNNGFAASLPTSIALTITGPNPASNLIAIPSIAPNTSITVDVATRMPSNLGIDTIRVAVVPDQNNSNNLAELFQVVTNTNVGYTTNAPQSGAIGFNAGSGLLACKYKINTTRYVKSVKIGIANNLATVGKTIYGVVLDSGGVILRRSPNYIVQAADLNTIITLQLDTAAKVSTGTFYAALAQTVGTPGYFPLGVQAETTPARSGTYYGFNIAGGVPGEATTLGRYMVDAVLDGVDAEVSAIATNGTCPGSNKSIDVTLKNNDPLLLNFAMDSVKINVTISGPIPQSFTKTVNTGSLISGATQMVNVTSTADFSTAGTYTISAKLVLPRDLVGSNDSAGISVIAAPIVVNLGSDISTCNASTILDAGNAGSTYAWNDASSAQTLTVTANGTYSVTVTRPDGCSASDTINVILNSGVATSAISPSTATICAGDSVVFIGGPSGGTFSANATSGTFIGTSSGTFDVVYTVVSVCGTALDTAVITVNAAPIVIANASAPAVCAGESATVTGGGAVSYVWSNGLVNGSPFIPVSTNTYTVTGTDANGCSNTASVSITVNPLPMVTAFASSNAVCAGTSVTLNGGGAASYVWSFGITNGVAFVPTSSLTYTVTGTDANGCSNTANQGVVVNAIPVASFTTSIPLPFCAGTNVTLIGTPAGGTFAVTSGAASALTANVFNAPVVGPYAISYSFTDANGCSDTANQSFNIACVVGLNNIELNQDVNINAIPNPSSGIFDLSILNTQSDRALVKLLSVEGRLLSNVSYDLQGNTTIKMNMNNYASGIYYINISNDSFNRTIKIVKQ